ncbi:unnamed protein product, partial [Symbiodinium sp. KB8]
MEEDKLADYYMSLKKAAPKHGRGLGGGPAKRLVRAGSNALYRRFVRAGAQIDTSTEGLEMKGNEFKGAKLTFGEPSTPPAPAASAGNAAASMPPAKRFAAVDWRQEALKAVQEAEGADAVSVAHCAEAAVKAATTAVTGGDDDSETLIASSASAVAAQLEHAALVGIVQLVADGALEADPAGGATHVTAFPPGMSAYSRVMASPATTQLVLPPPTPKVDEAEAAAAKKAAKKAKKEKKEK